MVVDTPPAGNGNGRIDPLETVPLRIVVRNAGQRPATGVSATLRSGNRQLAVVDSFAVVGTVAPGETTASITDGFVLAASSRLLPGTPVVCTLLLRASSPLPESIWPFELVVGSAPAVNVATLDTGMVCLSVSSNGGIGSDEPGGRGQGFRVPKDFPSSLRFASFAVGNSPQWLVDHYYGRPSRSFTNHDWVTLDTLRRVPNPWPADERWQGKMSDVGHPAPAGIVVEQNWYQNCAVGYHDLWALGVFDITNAGESLVTNLCAGVLADFAVFPYADSNRVFFDTARRAARVQYLDSPAPTAGLVLLDPQLPLALGAADNARRLWPDSCLTEEQKWLMLSGQQLERDSTRPGDWTVVLAAGLADILPGETRRIALAVVGSINAAGWLTACDTAQAWYDRFFGGVGVPATPDLCRRHKLAVRPTVVSRQSTVAVEGLAAGRVELSVVDIAGRTVFFRVDEIGSGNGKMTLDLPELPIGVYSLRAAQPGRPSASVRLVRLH